jgi:Alpha/beta hydrolase family
MSRFVLIPGAGGSAWYWHRVIAELRQHGHDAVAVDLPAADPAAGLDEYRELIVTVARTLDAPVVLVAQSLAGFSAPLACADVAIERLVLVNAMVPSPGETAGEWWDAVGWSAAARAGADRDGRPAPDIDDPDTLFFHDIPAELVEVMHAHPEAAVQSAMVFGQPWPLDRWPDVATTVVAGRDDRLFPIEFQRRDARERLDLDVVELPGGHMIALSQPAAVADQLAGG